MSRGEADRTIRLLDEFGPAYFKLSQVTRISAGTFHAIAPALSDGALHYNGEVIPLTPENSQKVAAAVAEMRSALPKKSAELSDPEHAPAHTRFGPPWRRRLGRTRQELARRTFSGKRGST